MLNPLVIFVYFDLKNLLVKFDPLIINLPSGKSVPV